jgi:hypothetical protein
MHTSHHVKSNNSSIVKSTPHFPAPLPSISRKSAAFFLLSSLLLFSLSLSFPHRAEGIAQT